MPQSDILMRVYHFICKKFGMEDLRERRLKVSLIPALNDPFEFLAVGTADQVVRDALSATKRRFSKTKGLLCFSGTWRSPLMWAHYADNHRGICAGFDVPDDTIYRVTYVPKRAKPPAPSKMLTREFEQGLFLKKFSHWRYEQEYRAVVTLSNCREIGGVYFVPFSDELALKQVIVGAKSNLSSEIVESVTRDIRNVEVFKARPAFRTFRIVRQQGKSW